MRHRVDEEIRHHIKERAERLVEEGWECKAALHEAERRFGNVDGVRRELMSIDGTADPTRTTLGGVARSFWWDVRHALRGMRNNVGFTLAVVVTLALGIGAASSIFAVVDALLIRPLPFRDAHRLVEVDQAATDGGYIYGLSVQSATEWKEDLRDLTDGWLEYEPMTLVRTDGPVAEPLSVLGVTPGADTLLGIPLLLGRSLAADDALPSSPEVAVLGRAYFERLGGDPTIVGRTIDLETGPATVVGVLAGGVKFPLLASRDPALWMPLRTDHTVARKPLPRRPTVWARLRPDIALAQAEERADAMATSLDAEQPKASGTWRVGLVPLGSHRVNTDIRQALWLLVATVAMIFLIALVNGVNLLLVRASGRSHEMAVRAALGGSRRRVLGQLLVEGLLLGLTGGGGAVLMAWAAVGAIQGILPRDVLFFSPYALTVEGRTLVFAFVVSTVAGGILGLLPGLSGVFPNSFSRTLAGRSRGDQREGRRARNAMVVLQVTLSMTLLAAAGLFVKSLDRLVHVDPGFDYRHIAVADIELSAIRYPRPADRADFLRRLHALLETRPGVHGVTVSDGSGYSFDVHLQAEGAEPRPDQPILMPFNHVHPDYFGVMGIELVEGRAFGPADEGTGGVIIDEDMERFLWGGRGAVGKRFRVDDGDRWLTVVGVVRDLRLMGRDQRQGASQILYAAATDAAWSYASVAVRSDGDPATLLPIIQQAVRTLDPQQALYTLQTAAQALADEEQKPRFIMTLMTLLAGIAVTLAGVGLYGTLSYSVSRRDRELGIRMALGAHRGSVRGMVLREGIEVAVLGILMGILGAMLASKAIQGLLYDVAPRDPQVLVSAALFFLGIAAVASFLPARRATRLDPVEVLKAE